MQIECGVTCEQGMVRSSNEDNYLMGTCFLTPGTAKDSRECNLTIPAIAAVCDGMGGSGYGQEAALTAVRSLRDYSRNLVKANSSEIGNSIETLIQKVNLEVAALKQKGPGAGSTIAMAYLAENKIYFANVGDSRIYQYRQNQLKRLSVDHNRLQAYLDLTQRKPEQVKIRGGAELTQFLGVPPEEFLIEPHYAGSNYDDMTVLLCSDGLTSALSEEEISAILENRNGYSMKQLSQMLVREALRKKSKDNITAMLIHIEYQDRKGRTAMNNFNPHILEPFWESWKIDSFIGEGSFGYVYKIYKEEFGQKYYSALKIISLPKTEAEVKEIMYETTDQNTATQYFRDVAEEIYKEIQIMEELKGKTNIVSFEDHKIIRKEDGIGYYILIRMELLTCLNDYLLKHSLTTTMLLAMAKDLCKALELCRKRNIIHRDIKPANIFVSADGDYKLGDFGIARQLEGMESGLSIKGTYSYMAPEVYMGNQYDERADLYSLGMVLYYYLNKKRAPFLQPDAAVSRYSEKQEAMKRRFSGEELPDPCCGSRELIDVVKKACAFRPEDRYASASEFLQALESIGEVPEEVLSLVETSSVESTQDTATVSQPMHSVNPVKAKEKKAPVFRPEELDYMQVNQAVHTAPEVMEEEDEEDEETVVLSSTQPLVEEDAASRKKSRKRLGIMAAAGAAVIVLGTGAFLYLHNREDEEANAVAQVTQTPEPTALPTEEATPTPTQEPTPVVTQVPEETPAPTMKPEEVEEYELEKNAKGLKDFKKVKNLAKVTSLTMQENKLTSLKELKDSTYLTYLDLESNKIKSLDGLQDLTQLEFLNLKGNQVGKLDALKNMDKLNTLILSGNRVKDIHELKKLTSLRELRLDGNQQLSDISALKGLKEMQVLDLSGTSVKDVRALYHMKNLKILNLKDTKVSQKQIEKLKDKLSSCTVIQ